MPADTKHFAQLIYWNNIRIFRKHILIKCLFFIVIHIKISFVFLSVLLSKTQKQAKIRLFYAFNSHTKRPEIAWKYPILTRWFELSKFISPHGLVGSNLTLSAQKVTATLIPVAVIIFLWYNRIKVLVVWLWMKWKRYCPKTIFHLDYKNLIMKQSIGITRCCSLIPKMQSHRHDYKKQ